MLYCKHGRPGPREVVVVVSNFKVNKAPRDRVAHTSTSRPV